MEEGEEHPRISRALTRVKFYVWETLWTCECLFDYTLCELFQLYAGFLLRSRVLVCLVNYENQPYLNFDGIKTQLCKSEDIHQKIFLPKFHENPAFSGEVDSIYGACSQQSKQSNQLPPMTFLKL